MDMQDMNVRALLELTASDAPAPGGGAIAALSGAFGAALAAMVGSLTLGKKVIVCSIKELKLSWTSQHI